MHADGGVSNGNVALAPRKSELYTMPSQDPTDDWLEHLCVHEFRHVVQLDKVNQGLTKDLYYLFGEIFSYCSSRCICTDVVYGRRCRMF